MSTQSKEGPDEDLELIFITVVSETLGGRTYMSRVVQSCIRKRMPVLSGAALNCLEDALAEAKDGDAIDVRDMDGWLELLEEIREEKRRRKG